MTLNGSVETDKRSIDLGSVLICLGKKGTILERTGLVVEGGEMFIDNGAGAIRMNVACPKNILVEGCSRLAELARTWKASGELREAR